MFITDELAVKVISDAGEFILFRDNEDYYSISGTTAEIKVLANMLDRNAEFLQSI